jgi:hypothetical protein
MRLLLLAVALTALPGIAAAQGPLTATATVDTPVYLYPDASRTPLKLAARGTIFNVVAEAGAWTQIEFNDPQFGLRKGHVATSALRFERLELQPEDLSVTTAPAAQPSPAMPSRSNPPAADASGPFERGWVDVNLGLASAAEGTFAIEANGPLYQETRTARATYVNSTGASVDVGGGLMLTPVVGIGMSISGTAHQQAVDLFASVPHPFAFNALATDTADADREFERTEGAVHLQVSGLLPLGRRGRLRLFGGPSYFRVEQDLVSGVRYSQVFGVFTRLNEIVIIGSEYEERVEATGWGYHLGTDASYFFNRVVGVGGFARFSRGQVEIEDPLSGSLVDLKAGGFQIGGGLRVKF